MNDDQSVGQTGAKVIAYPILIECDSRGRVLWMSDQAKLTFGEAKSQEGAPGWLAVFAGPFWRVLEWGDRILLSAQSPEPATSVALREASDLLRLETRMLAQYFRLQESERRIALQAQKRRGGGTTAVRLIEIERRRIALELHTGVGQLLAAIRLQLEIVSKYLPDQPAEVRLALQNIAELADGALQQVRSVSQRLHPPEWQRLSLPAALRQLWNVSGIPQRFGGSLRIEEAPDEPGLQVKVLLYRAAQEALSNLLRHSQATRVDGLLQMRAGLLNLTIVDDGVGFDPAVYESMPMPGSSGIGLRLIKQLAEEMGGGLAIESGAAGTKLILSVPCYISGR